ncbi:MAG: hypothetical protein DME97_06460 [Verrucomicrobia bacterium]|nr:MAG: hypothetical protein DME97_06460 [Verrucomicrobiota bacterium]
MEYGKAEHQTYGNGVVTAFAHDARGMTQVVHHQRATLFESYALRTYARDERDRITSFQKGSGNPTNPMEDGRGDHYWYDAEGQLTDADYGAIDPAMNPHSYVREDHFSYDALGNRFGWDWLANRGWMNFARRDNGLNQYSSWENNQPNPPGHWGSGIFYDDNSPWAPHTSFPGNGVTMADGWIVASYNALNQPVAIGSFATWVTGNWMGFGYDPLGRCVKRVIGPSADSGTATYFYYDGWNLVQEGTSPWTPTRFYINGARVDEIVQSYNSTTGLLAYHYYD